LIKGKEQEWQDEEKNSWAVSLPCFVPLPADTLRRTGGSLFFFHPDHLGSGALLTDANGDAYQFFVNLPFGETLAEQRTSGAYNNVYKFTGKELDSETGLYYLGARYYSPVDGIFLSTDPLKDKYPQFSPYVYCADNPVKFVDPDGRKFVDFDENGNYQGIKKDNWWHNLWHGTKGRVLDSNGNVTQKFKFADPKGDIASLKAGEITKLIFVQEQDVYDMVHAAGAFNETNRDKPADFLSQEGVGGGKFDFSYTAIPEKYSSASSDPLNSPSPVLFLAGNMAHNHMNFGNFLFGAGGATLGVHLGALRLGAHKNSRFPEDANGNRIQQGSPNLNGYAPQWDSRDDQRSIKAGYFYARERGYHRMSITVGGEVNKLPWYYRF
jgi:RHS repeat-associated protein